MLSYYSCWFSCKYKHAFDEISDTVSGEADINGDVSVNVFDIALLKREVTQSTITSLENYIYLENTSIRYEGSGMTLSESQDYYYLANVFVIIKNNCCTGITCNSPFTSLYVIFDLFSLSDKSLLVSLRRFSLICNTGSEK